MSKMQIITAVIVVFVAGSVGWYMLKALKNNNATGISSSQQQPTATSTSIQVSPSTVVSVSQMEGFNQYINSVLKFQVQYPKNWRHYQSDAEHASYWDEFDNNKGVNDPDYLHMTVQLEALSDKAFTAKSGVNILTLEDGTYYTKIADVVINGNQAVKFTEQQSPNYSSNIVGYFVKTKTQNGFEIDFSSISKKTYQANLALFDTIANSFISLR